MLPQELKAMGPDMEVFLYEGITGEVRQDPLLQGSLLHLRLLPKVDVPMLNV
jgi:type IV secretion system protein VirD4